MFGFNDVMNIIEGLGWVTDFLFCAFLDDEIRTT